MPTVIDANCLKGFQEARLLNEANMFSEMVEKAIERGVIAIDDQGKAEQEYYDCCRPSAVGLNLSDWIADQLVAKIIRPYPMNCCAEKKLRELGVPKKDLKWPSIAIGADADVIVTEDIDLFDPRAKKLKASAKNKIRRSGGPVSRYLSKNHGLQVQICEIFNNN